MDMGSSDNHILLAKLKDAIKISERRIHFIGFLNESETAFAREFLSSHAASHMFWGGYDEAERTLIGFFPDYIEPNNLNFPISAITFSYRNEDILSHRDFLGSFMALGVERFSLGDILAEKGRCVTFVKKEMEEYFLTNISKIGRVGVKINQKSAFPLPELREYIEISGVVASERVDCIVALLSKTSREKSVGFIMAGAVFVNHKEVNSISYKLKNGDVVSIRSMGRFIIDELGPLTKKGRVSIKCRKCK